MSKQGVPDDLPRPKLKKKEHLFTNEAIMNVPSIPVNSSKDHEAPKKAKY